MKILNMPHGALCAATAQLVAVFLFSVAAFAQKPDETPAAEAVEPAAGADAAETPDSVSQPEEKPFRRDPFWPIGYVPPSLAKPGPLAVKKAEQDEKRRESISKKEWEEATKLLSYQGIFSIGSTVYAVINGQMCRAGDVLTVRRAGKTFRFKVQELAPGKARLVKMREQDSGEGDSEL